MRTFREFLAGKKLKEGIDQTTFRSILQQLGGAAGAGATTGPANSQKAAQAIVNIDPATAVAVASNPKTEKAKSVADAALKKTQPNQNALQNIPNLAPNTFGAMPGTSI